MPARTESLHPLDNELPLWRATFEEGRTHVEHDGTVWPQAYTRAELLTRRRRLTIEPVVEHLRTRYDDARGLETVQLDGLPLLHLVPHHDLLRREVQLPFARQVIPAGNREDISDAEFHRRAGEIELCGLEHDHRRQDDDVGALLAEVVVIDRGAARGLLEDVQDADEKPAAPLSENLRHAHGGSRRPFARARKECRSVLVGGAEEAQIETRPAKTGRQLPPAGLRRGRHHAQTDIRAVLREREHERRPIEVREVLLHQFDVVPSRRERAEHRLVVPNVRGFSDGKENAQAHIIDASRLAPGAG